MAELKPPIVRDYAAGALLFREGEPGQDMYVIQSGVVQVRRRFGASERPLATLGRGEFVGEMAVLNGRPRSATAVALEDARCLVIDGETLGHMVAHNAEIALRLLQKMAARLEAADALVQILLDPDPKARVLQALRRQAEAFGEECGLGLRVVLSPADLAREAGVEPERAVEVLARLARLHIAAEDELGSVLVMDLPRLVELMDSVQAPAGAGQA
jgi:CRP-like cAMP-binding protein